MINAEGLEKITNGYFIATALKPASEMKTRDEDYIAAGTVNWVTQVAHKPLLMALSVEVDSHLNETIDHSGKFTLHLLSEDQAELVERFAQRSEITDETINGVEYTRDGDELILNNTLGQIECKLENSLRCGSHTLHIGKVVFSELRGYARPLHTERLPSSYQGVKA